MLGESVAPADLAFLLPQLRGTRRDFDHSWPTRLRRVRRTRAVCDLLFVRQAVQQVSDRLGMHVTMLQRDLHNLVRRTVHDLVDDLPHSPVVRPNLAFARPVRRLIFRRLSYRWIDAKFEEVVEFTLERGDIERLSADQVPIEGLQMA